MKKRICVLTATRAEYGLLKPIITKLNKVEGFDVRIAVTGMHLSPDYGLTYKEIEEDHFRIDTKIEILSNSDLPAAISKSMGRAMIGFGEYFEELKPDMLLVLGDRYETLAVCCVAMNAGILISHLYGGETTEGAVDESFRHAITKMSYLHFTSTEEYRKRVIQLGEAPERVFTVGAMGVENIKNLRLLEREELEEELQFQLTQPYAVVTFHPVTLEGNSGKGQFHELLKAIDRHPELRYIFTKANADAYGRVINEMIDCYVKEHNNTVAFSSLGTLRYLSALKHCTMVIGNSSSGLLEAPSFCIPTINIGDRQKGRLKSISVIDCLPVDNEIDIAIRRAQDREFRESLRQIQNPYGDGNTSEKVVEILKTHLLMHKKNNRKKPFYNIEFEVNKK